MPVHAFGAKIGIRGYYTARPALLTGKTAVVYGESFAQGGVRSRWHAKVEIDGHSVTANDLTSLALAAGHFGQGGAAEAKLGAAPGQGGQGRQRCDRRVYP